jgi:hypothetical protein
VSNGDAKPKGKWGKVITIGSALVVAATPGVYSAWQSAKQAFEQRLEKRVRDTQEGDLQAVVKANTEAIKALKASMVTHRDLVDLIVKLQASNRPAVARPTPRPRPRPNPAADGASRPLSSAIAALRTKAAAGSKARQKAAQALKRAPALKPAAKVRDQIEQKKAF